MLGRRSWAEVSLGRLCANFRAIRALVGPKIQILAVLKADAYGHGATEVAQALAEEGAGWFGVTCASEATPLRRAGLTQPILLFSGFWPGEEELLFEQRLTPTVFAEPHLRLLDASARKRGVRLPVHLKVDTGMTRLGIAASELAPFLELLRTCTHLQLEGLYTHLASAEEPSLEQTRQQLELFGRVRQQVEQAGFHPPCIHLANSTALARCPESWGTMVRPGLALYGYQLCESALRVEPVLSLKSRVLSLRWVPEGTALGYGASYVTPTRARIATVGAGYADGVNRALSNRGRALLRGLPRGCFAPVVGRVSMDFALLDVTAIPNVEVGDEVVFIGCQGAARITATEIAECAGTIPYEILCNIGPRVPHVYLSS